MSVDYDIASVCGCAGTVNGSGCCSHQSPLTITISSTTGSCRCLAGWSWTLTWNGSAWTGFTSCTQSGTSCTYTFSASLTCHPSGHSTQWGLNLTCSTSPQPGCCSMAGGITTNSNFINDSDVTCSPVLSMTFGPMTWTGGTCGCSTITATITV